MTSPIHKLILFKGVSSCNLRVSPLDFVLEFSANQYAILIIVLNIFFFGLVVKFYYMMNENDPEKISDLILAIVVGFLAFIASGLINLLFYLTSSNDIQAAFYRTIELSPIQIVLTIPLIEEISKDTFLYLFFRLKRGRFDSLFDGLVYGALLGSGFGLAENFVFSMRTIHSSGYTTAVLVTIIRGGLMIVGHPLFSGLFGYGLVYSKIGRKSALFRYFFYALMSHFFWNFVSSSLFLFPGVNFYIILTIILILALSQLIYVVYLVTKVMELEKELIRRGYYNNKRKYKILN